MLTFWIEASCTTDGSDGRAGRWESRKELVAIAAVINSAVGLGNRKSVFENCVSIFNVELTDCTPEQAVIKPK